MSNTRWRRGDHCHDRAGASQIAPGPTPAEDPRPEERIWQVVASIPRGRVTTYGTVAELAGLPRGARRVGRCLARLPADSRLPWHRVVNAALKLSPRGGGEAEQRQRLEAEGVALVRGRVPRTHRWPD